MLNIKRIFHGVAIECKMGCILAAAQWPLARCHWLLAHKFYSLYAKMLQNILKFLQNCNKISSIFCKTSSTFVIDDDDDDNDISIMTQWGIVTVSLWHFAFQKITMEQDYNRITTLKPEEINSMLKLEAISWEQNMIIFGCSSLSMHTSNRNDKSVASSTNEL